MPRKTIGELEAALEARRAQELKARIEIRRLKREMSQAARRREAQMLCVLGRAVLRFTENDKGLHFRFAEFLAEYVDRETDVEALAGTRFDLDECAKLVGLPVSVPDVDPDDIAPEWRQ